MNNPIGTSGQLFSVIAETVNSRGAARSGKGSAGQGTADTSFRDLLHTVSNRAKGASGHQKSDGAMNPLMARAHAARLADDEEHNDVERKLPESSEQPDSLNKPAQSGSSHRLSVSHELAALAELRPQAQQLRGQDSGPAAERASTGGGVATESAVVNAAADSGAGASVAVTPQSATQRHGKSVAPKAISAEAGLEPSAANLERLAKSSGPNAIQARASVLGTSQPSAATQSNPVAPNSISAAGGFEAIAANVERVAKSSVRDALPGAAKVSVVQQETHFPPVPQFTTSQQIADSVVAELKSSSASPSSAPADVTSSQSASPDQPLKVLTISLDPPALGNVTVRLRLTGDAVSVDLAASRRDTSQMLEQQRDSIRELMHSAGYVAEIAPVQHGTLDGLQAGSGQSHPSLMGQQQSSNGQGTLDGFAQSQSGARQTRQERQHNQETRHEQDVVSHNGRGAVYL